MSKLTHKCPNCGAMMPVDVKYCRKCHAKMDSGRVEVLSKPTKEQRPQKRSRDDDALRNLPKPVRPMEEDQPVEETAPVMENAPVEEQAGYREEDGYFPPEQQERVVAAAMQGAVVRRERRASANDGTPRPVSTARGAGAQMPPDKNKDKNLWQIITVLAIIFVIIIVAILLVVRLNQPADDNVSSDPYSSANVIDGDAPPAVPEATDGAAAPEGLVVPTATPAVTPTAVPTPSATPIPAPSVTPIPLTTPTNDTTDNNANTNANYSVTPVNETVYINGNGVNVRSGPGTEYSAIGSENTGKQLQRTGRTSNGWSQVAYNGQTAYVIDSLLTTTQPTTSNTTTAGGTGTVKVVAGSGANVRSGPGTNYSVLGVAAVNTELTRTGTSGSWTQVSYNGQTGYISTSLLSESSSGASTGSGSTDTGSSGVTAASGTLTVTGNGVNIRSGPGTNYNVLGSANSGTVFTVTGTSGSWYQISYNGQTAYIISDYVTKN